MIMMASKKNDGEEETPTSLSDVTKMPPRMTSVDDSVMLPESYEPKNEDVICSWARQNHGHPGNERFRMLIDKYAPVYLRVNTKYQKSEVIAKIVAEVRSNAPGGGFIKRDFYSGRWFEIGDEKARDKVGHAIRKAAGELSKKHAGVSSKKSSVAAQQKRRAKKTQEDTGNEAGADLGGATVTNHLTNPSLFNFDVQQMKQAGIGLSLADLRSNRSTASFLGQTINPSFLPEAAALNSSSMAGMPFLSLGHDFSGDASSKMLGIGALYGNASLTAAASGAAAPTPLGLDSNALGNSSLLQSLQRQRLLIEAAHKQNDAMNALRQSNDMAFLTQAPNSSQSNSSVALSAFNEMNSQGWRAAAYAGAGMGSRIGIPTSGLDMSGLGNMTSSSLPSVGGSTANYGSLLPASGRVPASSSLQQQQNTSDLFSKSGASYSSKLSSPAVMSSRGPGAAPADPSSTTDKNANHE